MAKRFFTQYWTQAQTAFEKDCCRAGSQPELLRHTAGNQLKRRGVAPGDELYIVTIYFGELYLLGWMEIGEITTRSVAARVLKCAESELYEAADHALAEKSSYLSFDTKIPLRSAARLRFVSGKTERGLAYREPGALDVQTLRSVRTLTAESARKLDEFLLFPPPVTLKLA